MSRPASVSEVSKDAVQDRVGLPLPSALVEYHPASPLQSGDDAVVALLWLPPANDTTAH